MVQVKKVAVRNRILRAAELLFVERGYVRTTVNQIAKRAGVSAATLYVYFASKREMAFAIFEPWIEERMTEMERRAERIRDPERRLRFVLSFVWSTLPQAQDTFFHNFIQSIAADNGEGSYKPTVLRIMQRGLNRQIRASLGAAGLSSDDSELLANLAIMASDGFVINAHLRQVPFDIAATVDMMVRLALHQNATRS